MDFRYSIIPIALKSSLNPGDTCKIRFFVSGYGNIKKNKLFISYHPMLVSSEKSGEIRACISTGVNNETGKQFPVSGTHRLHSCQLTHHGTIIIILNNAFFFDAPRKDKQKIQYPQIMSESIWDNLYPIEIDLNISKECSPGDYLLNFEFTYGDDENIKQDNDNISIHITSWLERHRLKIALIGTGGTIIGIVLGVISSL